MSFIVANVELRDPAGQRSKFSPMSLAIFYVFPHCCMAGLFIMAPTDRKVTVSLYGQKKPSL